MAGLGFGDLLTETVDLSETVTIANAGAFFGEDTDYPELSESRYVLGVQFEVSDGNTYYCGSEPDNWA